jgi:hypothetical protein
VTPRQIIVLGTLASDPYAGMAWMHMQIAVGLRRLGHDLYYFETSSAWPYDPLRQSRVRESTYTLDYLARVAESFGLGDRWAYRRSYGDKAWFGMAGEHAEELLAHADVVLNVAGATRLAEEGLKVGRLVYFGTDPVYHEIAYVNGDEDIRTLIEEHDEFVTYGENIGSSDCPVPPFSPLRARTRQPVLLDVWADGAATNPSFTTVCNWRQDGRDLDFRGETYYWSKHHEFLKFVDLPRRVQQPLELAMGLDNLERDVQPMLEGNGWRVVDAHRFTTDPWSYRKYVRGSTGEFTVAKDQNVRLRSGWFSERDACYLAAGRPVIAQDTAFGKFLPTGEGLFRFETMDEILDAFERIQTDYARHSRAARAIAEEYFGAEVILGRLIRDLGL